MLEFVKLRRHRVHKFKPKTTLHSEVGPYTLKTVSTVDELIAALKLRYEVFHHEMIGKPQPRGIDVDEFDFSCDHLIIVETKTGTVVGTYRLNASIFSDKFYSAGEFHIDSLLALPGTKLELGRACIHKNHRRGIVISLLWSGIGEYMAKVGANWLFGCASIKTESPRQAALLYRYFESQNRFSTKFNCSPTHPYTLENFDLWLHKLQLPLSESDMNEAESLVPPLCRAYMKAGAWIAGEPAYDKEFKCIDFLTVLDRENLNRTLWKKLKTHE